MAIREIILMGDPVLRKEADEVVAFDDDLKSLVRDMFETMYHADGIGLAAPQVGLSTRVIVIDLRRDEGDDQEPHRAALVNPVITWEGDERHKQSEGCLSIPGLEEIVILGVRSGTELLLSAPGVTAISAGSVPGSSFEVFSRQPRATNYWKYPVYLS